MTSEINKLKTLYQQLDRQQAAGEDVVTDLKKEINNLELAYLKEQVLPHVAQFIASKVRDLRCSIDCSFQFDGEWSINYSFCTSGSMLFAKDTLDMRSISDIPEIIAPQPQGISQPTIESKTNSVASKRLIRLVDYSEKSIALYGDTKDFKDELKHLGGYFNPRLRGGIGWIFSKKRIPDLKKLLGPYLQNENETNSAAPRRLMRLVYYSEKAIALYGDTTNFKKELKNLGGRFIPRLQGGAGWIFTKKQIPDLKKLLGSYLQNENIE